MSKSLNRSSNLAPRPPRDTSAAGYYLYADGVCRWGLGVWRPGVGFGVKVGQSVAGQYVETLREVAAGLEAIRREAIRRAGQDGNGNMNKGSNRTNE